MIRVTGIFDKITFRTATIIGVSSRLSEERISQKIAILSYLYFFKGTFHNFQEEY